MPGADPAAKWWRVGFLLAALAVGMLLGAFLSGGLSSADAGAASPIGPDVGEIRLGSDDAGPTDRVEGVGVGFAQSEDGAVAAATNLVLTLEQAGTTDRASAIRAYEILGSEGSKEILMADMAATWDTLQATITANAPRSSGIFLRTVPVGHELVRYSADRATVEVWTLTLIGATGMLEPQATWETATVEVVWEADDWKIWSAVSNDGPSPAWTTTSQTTDTSVFLAGVGELEGYRYVAD